MPSLKLPTLAPRWRKLLLMGAGLGLASVAAVAWYATRTPASPFDGLDRTTRFPAAEVAKGRYVAQLGDCVACHSVEGGAPFAGGLEMKTPMGSIFATNITPDPKAGVGGYTLADFDRAVRRGVAKDGHRLYPAMPYPSYARMSDEDVRALYAYVMQAVPASPEPNRKSQIPWPLNMRWPLALWNAVFGGEGQSGRRTNSTALSHDPLWTRGAYLVQGPGHCGACHTPRGLAMNEKGLDERSRHFLAGGVIDGWYAPSLRGDHNVGLGRWSEDEIVQFLKSGRNRHGVAFGSMAEVFNNSTQFMSDGDLKAIAHYLKSLPGDGRRDGAPWRDTAPAGAAMALERVNQPGAQTYYAKCSFCHGADGRGKAPWMPPLGGSASMMSRHDASAINITLNGSRRLVAGGRPDAYRMPAFREQLSDQQIADVLSYARGAWGNRGPAVSAKTVAKLREDTRPASATPSVLSTP